MKQSLRSPRPLIDEMVVFATLLVVLVAALAIALGVRVFHDSRRWRKLRALLQDWMDERERTEEQESS